MSAAAALLLVWIWARHTYWELNLQQLTVALIVTAIFAALARVARGVDTLGAVAGAVVAFILASADVRLFWILLIVFVLTLAATKFGRTRKSALERRESKSGRSAAQVMANLGIATTLVALGISQPVLLSIAALTELAADTCSSEMGMALPGTTILITTWKRVVPGTDGGMSLGGSLAGCMAAFIVAEAACLLGLVSFSNVPFLVLAGIGGMLFDSILGGLLERRGVLGNNSVNLLGTTAAAVIMWLLA